jgi:HSP20 family protein
VSRGGLRSQGLSHVSLENLRTDPFRELDALAQQLVGTVARPSAMPMDAYRSGEAFLVLFDLPGVVADSIELTVEQNVLTVSATRSRPQAENVETVAAERPPDGVNRPVRVVEPCRLYAFHRSGVPTRRRARRRWRPALAVRG